MLKRAQSHTVILFVLVFLQPFIFMATHAYGTPHQTNLYLAKPEIRQSSYNSNQIVLNASSSSWNFTSGSQIYAAKHQYDFRLHKVTVIVKDEAGNPVKEAFIKAFSRDWGVMYPHYEEWGLTDTEGTYKFILTPGNWVFIASSGRYYSSMNPNKGFFVETSAYIGADTVITLKPKKSFTIRIVDEKGTLLSVDELYAFSSRYIPAIPPALIGYSTTGILTLYTNLEDQNLTIIAVKRPSTISDGYILVKGITPLQNINVVSSINTSKLIVNAYESDGKLSNYWNIEFRLPELYLGNWVYAFQITGRNTFHITPMKVVINARYIPPGWYYYFESIALSLEANRVYTYSFGGKGSFRLWIIRQDTQLWLDVRDEFGNVLAFYADHRRSTMGERNIIMRVFERGTEVYNDNIGKYIPGTLFYGIGKTFADEATFELSIDLGPLGGLGKILISGLLYDKERLVKYKDVQSRNFIIHMPVEYFWNISGQARDHVFIETLETVYKSMGDYLGENLQNKPHRVEINFVWAGVGGTSFVGFGLGVARWPVHVHHGWLGVLSHELGHMYSFTPPLVYYVNCPVFCEPLATYLGIEAVSALYGPNVRLWYWGTHPGFFDYISGDRSVSEIERMQFIFFYLHKVYGPEIHKQFIQLWANNTALKDKLIGKGFNVNETMIILYSYLALTNLAWLFQLAGYAISEEKVNMGLRLAFTETISVTTTLMTTVTITTTTTKTATKTAPITTTATVSETRIETYTIIVTQTQPTVREIDWISPIVLVAIILALLLGMFMGFAFAIGYIIRKERSRSIELY